MTPKAPRLAWPYPKSRHFKPRRHLTGTLGFVTYLTPYPSHFLLITNNSHNEFTQPLYVSNRHTNRLTITPLKSAP